MKLNSDLLVGVSIFLLSIFWITFFDQMITMNNVSIKQPRIVIPNPFTTYFAIPYWLFSCVALMKLTKKMKKFKQDVLDFIDAYIFLFLTQLGTVAIMTATLGIVMLSIFFGLPLLLLVCTVYPLTLILLGIIAYKIVREEQNAHAK